MVTVGEWINLGFELIFVQPGPGQSFQSLNLSFRFSSTRLLFFQLPLSIKGLVQGKVYKKALYFMVKRPLFSGEDFPMNQSIESTKVILVEDSSKD